MHPKSQTFLLKPIQFAFNRELRKQRSKFWYDFLHGNRPNSFYYEQEVLKAFTPHLIDHFGH